MRYPGIARKEQRHLAVPDAISEVEDSTAYGVVEIGSDILLMPPQMNKERLAQNEMLAKRSIGEHRETLEGLAS